MPFHVELAAYFHALVAIFGRADCDPSDFDTVFGFSSIPYYMIHLSLQRAHDEKIAPSCAATVCPPALRPNDDEDLISYYHVLSHDSRFAHLAFPNLDFGRDLPPGMKAMVLSLLRDEHKAYIDHL